MYIIFYPQVRIRQDLGKTGVEDMIQLSDLNEASLLWNLRLRYDSNLIYTYVGSILVAVNPYRMFDIYGLDTVAQYENQVLGTLPPHLFAVGKKKKRRCSFLNYSTLHKTRTTIVVRNTGCARSRYTLKLSLIF